MSAGGAPSPVTSYKYPFITKAHQASIESFETTQAQNGYVWRSDQGAIININLSSNSLFLNTVQSYLSSVVTPMAANDTVVVDAATRNSFQGMSRIFSSIAVKVGGETVEQIDSYDDLLSLQYATLPTSKKKQLEKCEGYGVTNAFKDGARKFIHPIWASLLLSPQQFPLPLAVGGLTLSLTLAPVANLFTTTNVAYYTVSQLAFKWQSVSYDPAFTMALKNAVSSGKSAYIPYQKVRLFPQSGNGAQVQNLTCGLGQYSSVDGFLTTFWDSAAYAVPANDKALRWNSASLTSAKVDIADVTLPHSLTWNYGGVLDPELWFLANSTLSGDVYRFANHCTYDENVETTQWKLGYTFSASNEDFAAGISMLGSSSPNLVITTTHSANVMPHINCWTFVFTSALLEFNGQYVYTSDAF